MLPGAARFLAPDGRDAGGAWAGAAGGLAGRPHGSGPGLADGHVAWRGPELPADPGQALLRAVGLARAARAQDVRVRAA
jgi:hypothetical protein